MVPHDVPGPPFVECGSPATDASIGEAGVEEEAARVLAHLVAERLNGRWAESGLG